MAATDLDVYAPFDTGAGANVQATTWRLFMRHMLGTASGIIRGMANEFAPTATGSAMSVTVDTGDAWMRGHYGQSTALKTLAIAASHATLPRSDRIVLRVDFVNNKTQLDILTGTPNASPITPAVTQSTIIWETSVGIVTVAQTVTVITAANVADDRVFTGVQGKYQRAAASGINNNTLTAMPMFTGALVTGDITPNLPFASGATGFTLNRAGLWSIIGKGWFDPNVTGVREARLAPTGNSAAFYSLVSVSPAPAASSTCLIVTATERLTAGTQVSLWCNQSSGGGLNVTNTELGLIWLGP